MSDFIQVGSERFKYVGAWPPPYHVQLPDGRLLKRVSYSKLTEPHPNVARGALYERADTAGGADE